MSSSQMTALLRDPYEHFSDQSVQPHLHCYVKRALQMWGTTIPKTTIPDASLTFPFFASHIMYRLCLTQDFETELFMVRK